MWNSETVKQNVPNQLFVTKGPWDDVWVDKKVELIFDYLTHNQGSIL